MEHHSYLGEFHDQIQEQERLRDSASTLTSPQPRIYQNDPSAQHASLDQQNIQSPGIPLKDDAVITKTETVDSALLGQPGLDPDSSDKAALPRRRKVIRYWTWEILGLVLATGSLAATFGTLAHFDGLQVPNWPLGINLTSLVSLFVTVFTTGIAASLSGVISQAKWSWFASPRPLKDLASFDKASRGTVGSIGFLLAHRRNALSSIAAIVSLVSLVAGPFAQQAIRPVTCQYANPDSNGTIPVANFVSYDYFWNSGEYLAGMDSSAGMVAAMISAISATGTNDSAIVPSCPTANCTFSEYQGITHSSIGLCSACFDSSAAIYQTGNVSNFVYNYTLPIGIALEVHGADPTILQMGTNGGLDNLTWASRSIPANLSTVLPASLLNMTTIVFTGSPCFNESCFDGTDGTYLEGYDNKTFQPLAVTCALYPCLKNYKGEVVNGQFNETLVSTVPAPPVLDSNTTPYIDSDIYSNYTAIKSPCIVNGQVYDTSNFSLVPHTHEFETVDYAYEGKNITAPYECIYSVGGIYASTVQEYFYDSLFTGSCIINQYHSTPQCENFWMPAFWNNGTASVASVAAVVDQFTTGMTTNFRKVGTTLYGHTAAVGGVALTTTVCTRVEWGWLALPTVLLGLGLGLQCWAILMSYANQKQPVWKSSVLPLLYHGFVNVVDMAPGRALDEDELQARAERVKVRFRSDSDAVGFEARYNP